MVKGMMVMDSTNILRKVKDSLGEMIAEDDSFDKELIELINFAILSLTQVGCVKELYSPIDSETNWEDIVNIPPKTNVQNIISAASQYTYLNVKMKFDPPVSGVTNIFEKNIDELLWRIEVEYDR